MLNVMKMKLFPIISTMISIPINEDKSYNIIFMSENSTFMDVYSKLNIRRQFSKRITVVPFKNPRVFITMKDLIPYKKKLGLIPIMLPETKVNTYIDTEPFFNILDSKYGKQSYKRSVVFQKIITYFNMARNFGDANSILMYHVDLSKPIENQFLYRRSSILALISQIGDGSFPFDNVVIAIEKDGLIKFTSIYNKNQKSLEFTKVVSILKRLVPKKDDIESNEEDDTKLESYDINSDQEEKESILRFINKHMKNKILTS